MIQNYLTNRLIFWERFSFLFWQHGEKTFVDKNMQHKIIEIIQDFFKGFFKILLQTFKDSESNKDIFGKFSPKASNTKYQLSCCQGLSGKCYLTLFLYYGIKLQQFQKPACNNMTVKSQF